VGKGSFVQEEHVYEVKGEL